MMWHCAKVSCTSWHSIWLRTAFWFRSCAVGVNLCSFSNSLRKFYFITIFINTKSMGTTRHCSLVNSTPSQSTELVLGVRCFGVKFNLCSFHKFLDEVLFHHDNYKCQANGYDTTLFIGQQHTITVYRTGFWVCVVLVFNVICVPLTNPLMKLYFIMIIILCIISHETKFSPYFLFGLRCIFQLPGSGICVWCVLLGSFCVPFTNSLIKFFFIMIIIKTKSVGTTRHCSLVSSTPSQSIGLVFGCALFWCSVSFVFL